MEEAVDVLQAFSNRFKCELDQGDWRGICHSVAKVGGLLLGKGGDLNVEGGGYCTTLQAAPAEGQAKMVEMLLAKGS